MGITKQRLHEIKNAPNYLEESKEIIRSAKEYSDIKSKKINKLGNELLSALA